LLYLHIGSYKTGSSAIQSYLSKNKGKLKEMGTHVLRPPEGRKLYAASKDLAEKDLNNPTAKLMRQKWLSKRDETVTYSNEYLFNPNAAQQLKANFDPENEGDVRIICYIRRPDSYVEALYKQMVKNGRIDPDPSIIMDKFRAEKAPYQAALDSYADAFGTENVTVRIYERDQLKDRDAVADFLDQCNMPAIEAEGSISNNPSHSCAMSEAIGRVSRLLPVNHNLLLKRINRNVKDHHFRAGDVFTLAQSRALFAEFEDEMRHISERFLGGQWPIFNMKQIAEGATERFPDGEEAVLLARAANEDVMRFVGKLLKDADKS